MINYSKLLFKIIKTIDSDNFVLKTFENQNVTYFVMDKKICKSFNVWIEKY